MIAPRFPSVLSSMIFVACVVALAYLDGNWSLAIYGLSFWHYFLYWLAYRHGAVSTAVLMRDAIVMKSCALLALGWAYFSAPLDWLSLAVIAGGFMLNAAAARALGTDRTYYGLETGGLPSRRITAFPYSWISHPMLMGNMAAFSGTLINADFRRDWWPLACVHVALNAGLLVMELRVRPKSRGARRDATGNSGSDAILPMADWAATALAGALLGGAAGAIGLCAVPVGAGIGAAVFVYALLMYCTYTSQVFAPSVRSDLQERIHG